MTGSIINPSALPTPPRSVGQRRQVAFLSGSAMLEETGTPPLVRFALIGIVVTVAAFLAWAAVSKVSEVAVSRGQVIPTARIQTIQHLEGGLVSQILVVDGDIVEVDDVLIRLDGTRATAELEQMRVREANLLLEQERLIAFGKQRNPDFTSFKPEFGGLVEVQATIHEMELRALQSSRDVLKEQVAQREAELEVQAEQKKSLEEQIALLKEELAMRETLFRKNLSSKVAFLEIQRRVAQARGDLAQLLREQQGTRRALAETSSRLSELESNARREALTEMGRVAGELAEVREKLRSLKDRVARLEVRAPVKGVVKGLDVHTLGGVLAPGATILEIVPLNDELIVETKISTQDIGHVHVDQPVTVKVSAFDYGRYGAIPGILEEISASTFVDEHEGPYYRGLIRLERQYVGLDPERNRVLPGMTVQADIDTGGRTLLQYLLKPVYTSVGSAFGER